MTITTTTDTASAITSIIVASAFLDALVLGTYTDLLVRITGCDGITYDTTITSGDVTVVADADDTYTILPTVISATSTEFGFDYFVVKIYSTTTTTHDTLQDTGSVLTNATLECEVYTYLLNCSDTETLLSDADRFYKYQLIFESGC